MMGMDYGDIIDMFESQFQEAFLTQIEEEYGSDFYLECRISAGEELESGNADINVVKVNGRWYIDILAMG